MRLLYILFVFILSSALSANAQEVNILDHGAIADGRSLSTEAIQRSIDKAHKMGGGTVVFPKGVYLSGSIVLKSNVELKLLDSAIILGSTDPDHYLSLQRWKALILADGAENIKISGKGVIDGQGARLALHIDSLFYAGKIDSAYYNLADKRPRADIRPQLIEFVNCSRIEIRGVELRNAASWVQSYFRCNGLSIDSIRVESDTYWNNDGIDIIDSKNVRITNSYFNASDDGICLKSYAGGYKGPQNLEIMCDSIYIANCRIRSSASALKFGTSSYRGFKNITIEDIEIFDTYRSAIALESVHNGVIENVLIQNIKAENSGNAIFIRLGGIPTADRKGEFKNVLIRDVVANISESVPDEDYQIRGPALPFFHNIFPSSITGIPNNKISDETIINSSIVEELTCIFFEIGISYDANMDRAMKIIAEEAMAHPLTIDNRSDEEKEEGHPIVMVRVIGFGDSSVNLRGYVWAPSPADGFTLKCDLNKSIKERFDAEGIEIPFPYRTLVFKNNPTNESTPLT